MCRFTLELMNNKYSSRVTQPRSQGASQAMLYGIGLTDADLQKPQVGICSMWYEGNTCNMHQHGLPHSLDAARGGDRTNKLIFAFSSGAVTHVPPAEYGQPRLAAR